MVYVRQVERAKPQVRTQAPAGTNTASLYHTCDSTSVLLAVPQRGSQRPRGPGHGERGRSRAAHAQWGCRRKWCYSGVGTGRGSRREITGRSRSAKERRYQYRLAARHRAGIRARCTRCGAWPASLHCNPIKCHTHQLFLARVTAEGFVVGEGGRCRVGKGRANRGWVQRRNLQQVPSGSSCSFSNRLPLAHAVPMQCPCTASWRIDTRGLKPRPACYPAARGPTPS